MRVFFTLAALAVIAVTACTGVKAQEAEVYSIRIGGVASDGVTVMDTPVPTATPSPVPTATPGITPTTTPAGPIVEAVHWNPAVERWRWLVAAVFPGGPVDYILDIIQCESGGNPWATGQQGEQGLLQIHPRWHPDSTYDPEGNLRAAYRISSGGRDWSAWSCA